ncbi:winged helix-turn-helix domain-containing protein [Streptomyces sp. NPDC020379]|uniref:winged helix-turn-helix domain-containing protein n=1 Tax=Streptomyces sp. NPDC020379 TaxID=3365071 RepID=UPI0037B98A27
MAQAHGFEAGLWTLERVGVVVEQVTGVAPARASVWRLLTGRLGWSLQRPRCQAVERDDSEIARWVAQEWPCIKKGGEETCLDRVLRRIGGAAAAPGAPHVRASRPHAHAAAPAERETRRYGRRAGLPRCRGMRAWAADQNWLTLERLPAYASSVRR